jgi:anti-anti-sigma factor
MSSNPAPASHHRIMTIEHTVDDKGNPVLVCRGRFVLETSNEFKMEVKKLSPNHKRIEADLNGVDYVDSAGLGALLGIFISAKGDGCHLEFINVHPHVRDLINMTHLNSVFYSET